MNILIQTHQLEAFLAIQTPRWLAARLLAEMASAVVGGLTFLLLLLGSRMIFRNNYLAVSVVAVIITVIINVLRPDEPLLLLWGLRYFLSCLLLVRFGLLPFVFLRFTGEILEWPMTTDSTAWYFGTSLTVLLVALAIAAFGFYTSLRNRPTLQLP